MKRTEKDHIWDVIIIGGGPAGCTAAMVLARCCRNVLLFDEGKQRNLRSHGMHNFLSRDGMTPPDFLAIIHEELKSYPVTVQRKKIVDTRKTNDGYFSISDDNGNIYTCKRLLLASGITDNVPEIPGMSELWGCSVFHCPFCDGWECKDKIIGLYSKKINGFGMALSLSRFTDRLVLFTDGSKYLRSLQKKTLAQKNIQIVTTPVKELIKEEQKMLAVALINGEQVPCDALFVNNGYKVNNDLLLQLGGRCNDTGAAFTNKRQECNIKGLYVAGDASLDTHFVVVASAEGAKAAVAIHDDLLKEEHAHALLSKFLQPSPGKDGS